MREDKQSSVFVCVRARVCVRVGSGITGRACSGGTETARQPLLEQSSFPPCGHVRLVCQELQSITATIARTPFKDGGSACTSLSTPYLSSWALLKVHSL